MTGAKWFIHEGRTLEVRYQRVMTSYQIWVYESDRPLDMYSAIALSDAAAGIAAGQDVIGHAMESAMSDVVAGKFPLTARIPGAATTGS